MKSKSRIEMMSKTAPILDNVFDVISHVIFYPLFDDSFPVVFALTANLTWERHRTLKGRHHFIIDNDIVHWNADDKQNIYVLLLVGIPTSKNKCLKKFFVAKTKTVKVYKNIFSITRKKIIQIR